MRWQRALAEQRARLAASPSDSLLAHSVDAIELYLKNQTPRDQFLALLARRQR